MKKILRNLAKAAIAGAIIGVALSYALPALATWAGLDVAATVGAMAGAKWMVLFVGAFSVASMAANVLVNHIFPEKSVEPTPFTTVEKAAMEMCHAPELAQGGGIFCGRLDTERTQIGSGANRDM